MRDDVCEHGVDGFCMKCCREGEGKPAGHATRCGAQAWRAGQHLTCQLEAGHPYAHIDSGFQWAEPEALKRP